MALLVPVPAMRSPWGPCTPWQPQAPALRCRLPPRRVAAAGDPPVVPLPFSRRVFASSWLVAITTIIAALHGQVLCAFLCSLVLFGTVNYWRDPRNGWRRRADFFFANFGIGYHLVLSVVIWTKLPLYHKLDLTSQSLRPLFLTGPHGVPALSPLSFWIMWGVALTLYRRARACAQKGDFDTGTRWHVVFHIVGNLANILLYPALQRP